MNFEQDYHQVAPDEIIGLHDRLLMRDPGLPGMADPDRAYGLYDRVKTLYYYGDLPDVWNMAAAYLQAVSRGHVFNDANKRTALMVTELFLFRNGILLMASTEQIVSLTLATAVGDLDRQEIAHFLENNTQRLK